MQNKAIDKIVPTAFIMMRSGGYQNQHLRSWDLTGTLGQIETLAQHITASSALAVTPDLINAVAPGIMCLSPNHQGNIAIPDGWDSQRGVFILRFNVFYKVGGVFEWIVQGYTDNPAFSDTSIDPNMVFYINNVFCMNRTVVSYNGIESNRVNLQADYQVVNGFNNTSARPGGNLLIRPRDVLANISNNGFQGLTVHDATQLASFGVQTSRHVNNVPSMMLSSTLNGWHAAASEMDVTMSTADIASQTYGKVLEVEAQQDLFMELLAEHNANRRPNSAFTGNQLLKTMVGLMSVYQVINSAGSRVSWSSKSEGLSNGDANTSEKSIAINIQAMLPSIMIESLLSSVSFTMTNHNGRLETVRAHSVAFVPEMADMQWLKFKTRIECEIGPLFMTLGLAFWLEVTCSFYQEIKIYIKMRDEVQFIAPAFCSALYAPVQTTSPEIARQFAEGFEMMAVHINDALMESGIRRATADNVMISQTTRASLSSAFTLPDIPAPKVSVEPGTSSIFSSKGSMTAGLGGVGHTGGNLYPPQKGFGTDTKPTGQGSMTAGFTPAPFNNF